MAEILALEYLYNGVVDFFAARGWACFQPFGWREPAQQQIDRDRIVWVPGDRSGFSGNIIGTTQPGGVPRFLATLKETFYVVISTWADDVEPENELAQWRSTRMLFNRWYTAVWYTYQGQFEIVRPEWIQIHKERRSGTALIVTVTIQSPISDQADDTVTVPSDTDGASGVRGVIDVTELDVTEQLVTAPDPVNARAVTCTIGQTQLRNEGTHDGVAVVAGDVVLVNEQADSRDNGLYTVVAGGNWTRTADVLTQGFFVEVLGGATYGDTGFELITSDPVVIGTSPIVFEFLGPMRSDT